MFTRKEGIDIDFIGIIPGDAEAAGFGVHVGFFYPLFPSVVLAAYSSGSTLITTYSGRLKILGIRVDSLANPRLTIITVFSKS